jgi:peroxiredoxin Q/BCP
VVKKLLPILLLPFLLALTAGQDAPDFSARNQDGKTVHLSDYKGKFVVLYFYPKDETPGCTKEACNFRDSFQKLKAVNAVILGVSRQGEKSHQEFKAKHHLPFDLLADEDGSIAKTYDVGSIPIIGLDRRESVLIGPKGKILRIYKDVDPSTHTQEILSDIEKAK